MLAQAFRWLWLALRAVALGLALLCLLLQSYGLYIAAALTPRGHVRRRLDVQLHRALFAMDQRRLIERR